MDKKELVIACDQRNLRLVLYDMTHLKAGAPLDDAEVWSFDLKDRAGAINPSGVKFRTNTVFGDVVLTCASGGYGGIIRYPSKEVVWENPMVGDNAHSIELLPNGDFVSAASTGSSLRIYRTSALLRGDTETANTYLEYPLAEGHGALWDPAEQVLWALGGYELQAYALIGSAEATELNYLPEKSRALPPTHPHGHDLSPDLLDQGALFLTTNQGVLRFCKQTGEFTSDFAFACVLDIGPAKAFGNNRCGSYALCRGDGGKGTPWEGMRFASWCTPTVLFARPQGDRMALIPYSAADSAFYKVRIFCGEYQ